MCIPIRLGHDDQEVEEEKLLVITARGADFTPNQDAVVWISDNDGKNVDLPLWLTS